MHHFIKLCAGIFSVLIMVNWDYLTDSQNKSTVSVERDIVQKNSANQLSEKFNFKFHEIGTFQDRMGATALVDLDKDGDLDYVFGRFGDMYWYEYISPSEWILHEIGKGAKTDVGGVPLDVNRDGMIDFVVGDSWYENTGNPKTEQFIVHHKGMLSKAHDVIAVDIDNDGIKDIVAVSNAPEDPVLVWYKMPEDYKADWKPFIIGEGIHGGIGPHGYGDLNNNGNIDIVRGNSWFENVDGKGTQWLEHKTLLPPGGSRTGPFGLALKTWVYDIDKNGMVDVVQAEADTENGRVFWWENINHGERFVFHLISGENTNQDTHSLVLADFDDNGNMDILSGGGPLSQGKHKLFIWENMNGDGSSWKEHLILEGYRSHETVAGDVTGDGLVDIVSKPWRGGLHYFLENKGIE